MISPPAPCDLRSSGVPRGSTDARPTDLHDRIAYGRYLNPHETPSPACIDSGYLHRLADALSIKAFAAAVCQQVVCGIDIVTDGELSKTSFSAYAYERLSGFEPPQGQPGQSPQQSRSHVALSLNPCGACGVSAALPSSTMVHWTR